MKLEEYVLLCAFSLGIRFFLILNYHRKAEMEQKRKQEEEERKKREEDERILQALHIYIFTTLILFYFCWPILNTVLHSVLISSPMASHSASQFICRLVQNIGMLFTSITIALVLSYTQNLAAYLVMDVKHFLCSGTSSECEFKDLMKC